MLIDNRFYLIICFIYNFHKTYIESGCLVGQGEINQSLLIYSSRMYKYRYPRSLGGFCDLATLVSL